MPSPGTPLTVFLEKFTAIARYLRHAGPELGHVGKLGHLPLAGQRPQFCHGFATTFDRDYFAFGGLAYQLGRVDMKIANGSLLHVLHCSTWPKHASQLITPQLTPQAM